MPRASRAGEAKCDRNFLSRIRAGPPGPGLTVFGDKAARGDAREGMTLIGEEAFFHGSLVAKGSLRVEGVFEGDVSDAVDVEVGVKGRVTGNIASETLVLAGEVLGDVVASRSIEILAGGRLTGDLRAPKLKMEEGAFFDGFCSMASGEGKNRRRRSHAEPDAAQPTGAVS